MTSFPSNPSLVPRRFVERPFALPVELIAGVPASGDELAVLVPSLRADADELVARGETIPGFVSAGPRPDLAFDATRVRAGIVTCGGLCPGLNDVIRSITFSLRYGYGVEEVDGFRYGYAGLTPDGEPPIALTHDVVDGIHAEGGTLLGSSRGPQDVSVMVDTLVERDISMLFCIGGDGTLRGASAIADEIERRGLPISVVGVPKTIDNDIMWVERSFGFSTAVERGTTAIAVAHNEARGAMNGVGIVKLMGRHSGFIAVHASLANPDVNICLVPEVPFDLEGDHGLLRFLDRRLADRHHCVIVVAEGAGQEFVSRVGTDASGNAKLGDIGAHLRDRIADHCRGIGVTVKYIDPSYLVRGGPANATDGEFCLGLGQHAAHAAMAGFTDVVIGHWSGQFTIVPIEVTTKQRRRLDPAGAEWQRLRQATGQPGLVGPR